MSCYLCACHSVHILFLIVPTFIYLPIYIAPLQTSLIVSLSSFVFQIYFTNLSACFYLPLVYFIVCLTSIIPGLGISGSLLLALAWDTATERCSPHTSGDSLHTRSCTHAVSSPVAIANLFIIARGNPGSWASFSIASTWKRIAKEYCDISVGFLAILPKCLNLYLRKELKKL